MPHWRLVPTRVSFLAHQGRRAYRNGGPMAWFSLCGECGIGAKKAYRAIFSSRLWRRNPSPRLLFGMRETRRTTNGLRGANLIDLDTDDANCIALLHLSAMPPKRVHPRASFAAQQKRTSGQSRLDHRARSGQTHRRVSHPFLCLKSNF